MKQSIKGPSLGPIAPLPRTSIASPSYSSNRTMVQELTLPIRANLNIPPSPPGSPHLGLDEKILHFLSLKNQGTHFNSKLASSSALQNPSLLAKLIESAGLDKDGAQDQHATTLSRKLWNPHGFPDDAYKNGLMKMQHEAEKKKMRERMGKEREFVTTKATRNA